jgi:sigma-B regulation protein RsbU (phosphoserine phosphatase)
MSSAGNVRIEPPGKKILDLRTNAHPEHLKEIRTAVQGAASDAGCDPQCTEDIVIAVNEACMNVIEHGYKRNSTGEFIVQMAVENANLLVWISDFCARVDPDSLSSRDLEDIRPGGLGIHFMHQCMDEVDFLQPPEELGNLLQMIKRIT